MKKLKLSKDSLLYEELAQKDNHLIELFSVRESISIVLEEDYFLSLLSAIISQQLSGRVAEVIYQRVLDFYKRDITPAKIIQTDTEVLRELGLSYRKVDYIKSLAEKVTSREVHFQDIDTLTNEEIIEMLTKIKGIGPWTAEMFLIFSLGRLNVFSVLDLGLRNGLTKLYQEELSQDEMVRISKKWAPFQTYVSLYLWKYNSR